MHAAHAYQSPVGEIYLIGSEAGIERIAWEPQEPHDGESAAKAHLQQAFRELDEYFARRRVSFDVALADRRRTRFQERVDGYLLGIGYGHTVSYKAVADGIGAPGAVRAVGGACSSNPTPILVPCHRVLRSDGALGGYVGGPAAKRFLLDLEGLL